MAICRILILNYFHPLVVDLNLSKITIILISDILPTVQNDCILQFVSYLLVS